MTELYIFVKFRISSLARTIWQAESEWSTNLWMSEKGDADFMRAIALHLFIARMDSLSFRLISSPGEAEEGQKGLSKNGGSASSSTDHSKPSLKQNGVINHMVLINQFGHPYYSNWIHACTGSEMVAWKCFIEPNWGDCQTQAIVSQYRFTHRSLLYGLILVRCKLG